MALLGLPWWLRWSRICLQCRKPGFDPWVRRSTGERNDNPLQYSFLENSKDRGAWWAMVDRVTKNRTWLRRPSTQHTALIKYAHEALSDPPCKHHCHLQYLLLPFPTFCLIPSRSRCCFLSLGPCLGHISSAWNVPLCLLTCQLSLLCWDPVQASLTPRPPFWAL